VIREETGGRICRGGRERTHLRGQRAENQLTHQITDSVLGLRSPHRQRYGSNGQAKRYRRLHRRLGREPDGPRQRDPESHRGRDPSLVWLPRPGGRAAVQGYPEGGSGLARRLCHHHGGCRQHKLHQLRAPKRPDVPRQPSGIRLATASRALANLHH